MVGIIAIVGALTRCALLQSMCDLKAGQMNMQHSILQEFMPYESVLGHDAAEATRNICCVKVDSTVDHSTVTRGFEKFCLSCKKFNNQVR